MGSHFGEGHDLNGADALMDHLTKADSILADKAYNADDRMRQKLTDNKCEVVIPSKKEPFISCSL